MSEGAYEFIVSAPAARTIGKTLPEAVAAAVIEFISMASMTESDPVVDGEACDHHRDRGATADGADPRGGVSHPDQRRDVVAERERGIAAFRSNG